ncbi:MAG: hypothetical protein LBR50_11175 [Tannerella sp.]|nr:hypothetical protein [Tannerella sp.]
MKKSIKYFIAFAMACLVFACNEEYVREIPTLDVQGELAYEVPIEGSVYYLTVTASEQFTATASKIWCKTEILENVTTNNLKITVEPNAGVIRSCEIDIVVYSLPTIKVAINQDGSAPDDSDDEPTGPQVVGNWQFKNASSLGAATIGNDLILKGDGFTSVAGPNGGKAVRVASGSYFFADHGIEANGESADGAPGAKVNEYTIMYDYRLPALDKWYCFLQTDPNNDGDGEIFIRPSGTLTNSNIGYSDNTVPQDANWHRLVISCKSPEYCKFYIDGKLFFEGKTTALALDNRYALDPKGACLIADEDGEDSDIDIAQITIWDQPLDDAAVAALGDAGTSGFLPKGPLVGLWLFNDADNLGAADIGNALEAKGSDIAATAGPSAGNGAVRVGPGSYFFANHGIEANGESADGAPGAKVNEYTILYDYRLPALDKWYCFLQTDPDNAGDGEIFIRPSGTLTNSNIGYSDNTVPQDANWHRLVISCKSPEYCKFYIDGKLFFEGKTTALALDNRYALDPKGACLIADEDGEDSEIDIAAIAIWDKPLTDAEIAALGAAGATIK